MNTTDQLYLSGLSAVIDAFEHRCQCCGAMPQPILLANNTFGIQHHHDDTCLFGVSLDVDIDDDADLFGESLGAEHYREWKHAHND